MHAKQNGNILILVLVVISLVSLFIESISKNIILEYQRLQNQIKEIQLQQQFEAKIEGLIQQKQEQINNTDTKIYKIELLSDDGKHKLILTYNKHQILSWLRCSDD